MQDDNYEDFEGLPAPVCRVIKELSLLFEISKRLHESLEFKAILKPVLEKLVGTMDFYHASLSIFNRATSEILGEEHAGLPISDLPKNWGALLSRHTALVIESARALLIPDLDEPENSVEVVNETTFATPSFKHGGASMISVPILHDNQGIGTICVIRKNHSVQDMRGDWRLLTLIAQLVAQSAKLRQGTHENIEFLRRENVRLQEAVQKHFRPDNMIGNSRAMQLIYHHIEQVADSQTTVLIRGESGVGKEIIAHAIHQRSSRHLRPFVKVNCAALPESIIESELFGHEKGAFTGAISMRKGRFELAHSGTLFLDEIGDLPPMAQAKLLRVLQEREFERVGGSQTIRCDIRLVAATNRDLESSIEKNSFCQDLYYRLNVFPIYVPPLRERKTDLLQLADYFIEKYSKIGNKKVVRISTQAIDMMMGYHWPGNVRELENCMERAVLICTDGVIHAHHLPPTLQTAESSHTEAPPQTMQASLDAFEKEQIIEALKNSRGIMAKAARQLGLTERILGLRLNKYNIQPKLYRPTKIRQVHTSPE